MVRLVMVFIHIQAHSRLILPVHFLVVFIVYQIGHDVVGETPASLFPLHIKLSIVVRISPVEQRELFRQSLGQVDFLVRSLSSERREQARKKFPPFS